MAYFRIRATQFGSQPFKVTAWGSKMSDATQKEVRVFPDGKQCEEWAMQRGECPVGGIPVVGRYTAQLPAADAIGRVTKTLRRAKCRERREGGRTRDDLWRLLMLNTRLPDDRCTEAPAHRGRKFQGLLRIELAGGERRPAPGAEKAVVNPLVVVQDQVQGERERGPLPELGVRD